MAEIINFSIDLTLIDKSKIKEVTRKNGAVAKFIDVTVFIKDEQDQYNNIASMALGKTKEEREANTPTVYIGNGKRVSAARQEATPAAGVPHDDLPF